MTVIADTKCLKADTVTGNRVNFVCHGERPIPYVAAKGIWHHMAHTLHAAMESRTHDLLLFISNVNCFRRVMTFCWCFLGHIIYKFAHSE